MFRNLSRNNDLNITSGYCFPNTKFVHPFLLWSSVEFLYLFEEQSWHSVMWHIWKDKQRQSCKHCPRQWSIVFPAITRVLKTYFSSMALSLSLLMVKWLWLLTKSRLITWAASRANKADLKIERSQMYYV